MEMQFKRVRPVSRRIPDSPSFGGAQSSHSYGCDSYWKTAPIAVIANDLRCDASEEPADNWSAIGVVARACLSRAI